MLETAPVVTCFQYSFLVAKYMLPLCMVIVQINLKVTIQTQRSLREDYSPFTRPFLLAIR